MWAGVVVNYEAGPALAACVASLLADDGAGGPPAVVVVDNGSRDGSVARLREVAGDVEVVTPTRNLGYAGAANRGIVAVRRRRELGVVAVCNADVTIEPGTGAAMLARFGAEADLGALGPRITNLDGTIYPSARSVPSVGDAVGHGLLGLVWSGNPFTRRYRQLDVDPGTTREVDWVSGAAIWLRCEALDEVGGWDDRYFMYVEDVDLCWRLREAGWRIAYQPEGRVEHLQGLSTDRHPYRMIVAHHRSLLRFAARRWSGRRRLLLVPAAGYLGLRTLLALFKRLVAGRGRMPKVGK